jgi:hypothetical protein
VQSLALEQVRAIYSGTITNWKEVGDNDEAVMAFQQLKPGVAQQNPGRCFKVKPVSFYSLMRER